MVATPHAPSEFYVPANNSCKSRFLMTPVNIRDLFPSECMYNSELVYGTIIPILATCVTIANSIIVTVFMKPHIRSHTTFILTMIAVADTLGILFPTGGYLYIYSLGSSNSLVPFSSCILLYVLIDVFRRMFNCISIWLTVQLAYMRYKCIHSPFTARYYGHRGRNIAFGTLAIFVITSLGYMPSVFTLSFSSTQIIHNTTNETFHACAISSSEWFGSEYPCIYSRIHVWIEMALSSLIPCIVLLGLDISILTILRKATITRDTLRRRNTFHPGHGNSERKGGRERPNETAQKETVEKLGDENTPANCSGIGSTTEKSRNKPVQICCKLEKDTSKTVIANESTKPKLCHTASDSSSLRSFREKMNNARRVLKKSKTRTTSIYSDDSAYDRLDRESRRTSWLIIIVVTIITTHEITVSVIVAHELSTSAGPLPLKPLGCFTIYLQLWGYIAYPLIFLLYCSMSAAFREEIWRVVTLSWICKNASNNSNLTINPFMSPCSVKRSLMKLGNRTSALPEERDSISDEDHDLMTVPEPSHHIRGAFI